MGMLANGSLFVFLPLFWIRHVVWKIFLGTRKHDGDDSFVSVPICTFCESWFGANTLVLTVILLIFIEKAKDTCKRLDGSKKKHGKGWSRRPSCVSRPGKMGSNQMRNTFCDCRMTYTLNTHRLVTQQFYCVMRCLRMSRLGVLCVAKSGHFFGKWRVGCCRVGYPLNSHQPWVDCRSIGIEQM